MGIEPATSGSVRTRTDHPTTDPDILKNEGQTNTHLTINNNFFFDYCDLLGQFAVAVAVSSHH